jgi:hypothetical protein
MKLTFQRLLALLSHEQSRRTHDDWLEPCLSQRELSAADLDMLSRAEDFVFSGVAGGLDKLIRVSSVLEHLPCELRCAFLARLPSGPRGLETFGEAVPG